MKRYAVVVPIAGEMHVEVEVPDDADEDDIYAAALDAHAEREDDCYLTWEFHQRLTSGDVLHASTNEWEYAEIQIVTDRVASFRRTMEAAENVIKVQRDEIARLSRVERDQARECVHLCDHGSPCKLPMHPIHARHETLHGCIFYDLQRPNDGRSGRCAERNRELVAERDALRDRNAKAKAEHDALADSSHAAIERLRAQRDACAESRRLIIEITISELSLCADAFEACSRCGFACGCGSAAKNVRAVIRRFQAQRPNDGRSGRCGIRISSDRWCVLDHGHAGEHE